MRKTVEYSVGLAMLVALALVAPHPAQATTIVAKNLSQLCAEADLVFLGTVSTVKSQWADPQQQSIETLVTFTQIEPLFGTDSEDVTLRFAGGQMGDIREEVGGMPHFTPDQRLVIFARRERSVSPIVGFNQGCLRVVEGPAGPVVTSADGHPITGIEGDRLTQGPLGGDPGSAMSLNQFLEVVRQKLQQREKAGS